MSESTVDLNEGDRVLISEIFANYSQRRNLYYQLMWTKMHLLLLGHVGYLKSIDHEKKIGVVVVMYVPDPENFELCQATCEWPLEALRHPKKVFFACGDSVALTRGKDTACVAAVSRVEINNVGDATYTVIARNSYGSYLTYTIENRQSPYNPQLPKREIFICPIYAGPRLANVMRDNCSHTIHSYKHTIHGYTTENLMNVISNWRDDSVSYAKLVDSIRANPEQIRTCYEGELPLFRAVSDNNWSLVVVLLALGADKFAKDARGRNIIHIAAERGFDKMLEGVLTLLPKEVNRTTVEGDTPLHLAARNAHAACIDRLLGTPSCQSSIQNENGDAPLHEVCALAESSNKKAAISRLLTNSRASIHQTNSNNMSPLQIAIVKGHVGTVEQLIQLRPPHRSLGTKNGMTPLHFAASCANVNIVNILISLGMEVHRKDKLGRGVLHYAVEKWTGQAERDMARLASIQALVHSGAPSNVVDIYGQTPLFMLIREIMKQNELYPPTLIPICAQLVKTNLNLDEMASRLRPHWQLATVCFLVANGADINIKDRKGVTALDLCQESTIRPIIVHISNIKIRSCLPMVSMNCNDTFDSAEVTMCTFMCQDNVASVRFIPCGHRVACVDCAQKTAFRRCPLCYHIISQAQDNAGNEIVMGCRSGEVVDVAENSAISEQVIKKIAEDAAREAKIAVEQEKQIELKALRERLEQLEMETSCAICMDSKITLLCSEKLAEEVVRIPEKWDGELHVRPDYSIARTGPGENGNHVILSGEEAIRGEEDMKKWFMNVHASDKISLDRNVPDPRIQQCKNIKYDFASLPKASVIIIFTDEAWTPLLRTVHSVVNRSPLELLHEVILLDDNSQRQELHEPLDEHIKRFGGLVKIVRKNVRHGLIRAKLAGAREATGEVIVFLDSHCETNHGWLEPLVQRIHEKRSAIICPTIDMIAAETMAYSGSWSLAVGGFSWALHFTWEGMPEEERTRRKTETEYIQSPTMAGGLLAANREYFFEIGGYDEEMDIWGGENLEISFRTWMCGGSIEFIPCSHVGHIFRAGHPYNMTGRNNNKDVHGTNSKRLAEVWMDDYKRLYYMHREDLTDKDVGDLTARKELRKRLNCKSFKWYLDNVAKGHFIMDEDVKAYGTLFTVVKNSKMCIDTLQKDEKQAHLLGVFPCQGKGSASQLMSLSKEGNLRRETTCATVENDKNVRMKTCSKNAKQNDEWTYESSLLKNVRSNRCLSTAQLKASDDLIVTECDKNDPHQIWKFVDPRA